MQTWKNEYTNVPFDHTSSCWFRVIYLMSMSLFSLMINWSLAHRLITQNKGNET